VKSSTNIDDGPVLVPIGVPVPMSTTGLPLLTLDSFSQQLSDGDLVNIVIEAAGEPSDRVEVRLRTQAGMWFKGVEMHFSGGGVVKLEAENGASSGIETLLLSSLSSVAIVFVKAKTFGVHTPMYELPGKALAKLAGKRIIFDWMKD
jgi:hypothetical protein